MHSIPTLVTLPVGTFESNCYLLAGDSTGLLIDPGADADRIVKELDDRALRLEAVLLTHGHVDHVSALTELLSLHPAPVYLHPADAVWAFSDANRLPPWYNDPPPAPTDLRNPCASAPLVIGEWTFRVLETPGHTPGGVCYHAPDRNLLFSGDTLFRGSIGRTDLPGADAGDMAASLRRLIELPPETLVYPGHGPATTLAEERNSNPWL